MSGQSLNYDPEWILYIRSKSDSLGYFSAIPGMKVTTDAEQRDWRETMESCKYDCLMSQMCSSFSYASSHRLCVLSQVPIRMGSGWDYYEKHKPRAPFKIQDVAQRIQKQKQVYLDTALRLQTGQALPAEGGDSANDLVH